MKKCVLIFGAVLVPLLLFFLVFLAIARRSMDCKCLSC